MLRVPLMSLHQRSRELRKFHRKRERILKDHGCHEPYIDRHYVCVAGVDGTISFLHFQTVCL